MTTVVFRVDASVDIGSGHVMRCLALADRLRLSGAQIAFVSADLPGNHIPHMRARGFDVFPFCCSVPSPFSAEERPDQPDDSNALDAAATATAVRNAFGRVDWIVVDHYALGESWEKTVASVANRVLVIDDLANRTHACDVLLDQNLLPEGRYRRLVPPDCTLLIGPSYALLREQFRSARQSMPERTGSIGRLLVSFGGSDTGGETLKALEAVHLLARADIAVDVAIGLGNPHRVAIERRASELPAVACHVQPSRMADLLTAADVAIGAGGSACWERLCLALPSAVISIAPNQTPIAEALGRERLVYYLGESAAVTPEAIAALLHRLIADPHEAFRLARTGAAIVDGDGTRRVCDVLLSNPGKR